MQITTPVENCCVNEKSSMCGKNFIHKCGLIPECLSYEQNSLWDVRSSTKENLRSLKQILVRKIVLYHNFRVERKRLSSLR